jgi:hypothetical protein
MTLTLTIPELIEKYKYLAEKYGSHFGVHALLWKSGGIQASDC